MLYEIIDFALENAFFRLGWYIIKQIVGLPMGDPISPTLAILYLSFDEHLYKLPPFVDITRLLIVRYVDDIFRLLMTNDLSLIQIVDKYIMLQLYEHDIVDKSINIIKNESSDTKFLDTDIIIYNNEENVKVIYHNKNADIIDTFCQNIGRFFHVFDYTSINIKLSAFVAILVRAFDSSTFPIDCFPTTVQLLFELRLLGYNFSENHLRSIFTKTNRIRRNTIWEDLFNFSIAHAPIINAKT